MWLRRSAEVLAEYREAADDGFWQRQWGRTDLQRYLARYRGGRLGYFDGPFRRHLPRDQPVLEAGCGRGQYVLALQRLGYDVHGVEYAEETVRAVREVEPSLRIRAADLRALQRLCEEEEVDALVVGLPLQLDGAEGPAVREVRAFIESLRAALGLPVEEVDERLTSRQAHAVLKDAGVRHKRRKELVDSTAAVLLLQAHLARRRGPQ